MAEQSLMLDFKSLRDRFNRLPALYRNRYRGLLAGIADVPMHDEATTLRLEPLRLQQRLGLADQSVARLHQDWLMLLLQCYRQAALEIKANIGVAHAKCAQNAGKTRDEHILAGGQAGDAGCVEGAGTAAGYQREASRIEALFDADVLNGMKHGLLGETYDPGGSFDRLKAERLGHVPADRLLREPTVERNCSRLPEAPVATGQATTAHP